MSAPLGNKNHLGKKQSAKARENMRLAWIKRKERGGTAWNKGLIGLPRHSTETRLKMSKTHKQLKHTYGCWKDGISYNHARYLRDYRKRNPEQTKIQRKKDDLLHKGINIEDWQDILWEYGTNCLRCGNPKITLDHIIPVSIKKINNYDNYQPLCQSCNSWKHTKIIDFRDLHWSYTEQLELLNII